MSVSFTEAAGRHAADATLLDTQRPPRTANANQLWGLAAECALKAVLRAVEPVNFRPDGQPKTPYREHIDKLFPLIATALSGRSETYLSSVLSTASNPFDRWSVHARYDSNADAPSPTLHGQHQAGAERCLRLLAIARLNGHHE